MSKVIESAAVSNRSQSNNPEPLKVGRKRGRPSNADKLERRVRALEDENADLRKLYRLQAELLESTEQYHKAELESWERDADDWKKIANDWKGLYFTLMDLLNEDGPTPQEYLSAKELAVRFATNYRIN